MSRGLSTSRLVAGLVLFLLLAMGGTAVGQTPPLETIAFLDAEDTWSNCCALPIELLARTAVKELLGIVRVTTDEASRQGTVVFDPARVSGAEVIAALERSGFRPIKEGR